MTQADVIKRFDVMGNSGGTGELRKKAASTSCRCIDILYFRTHITRLALNLPPPNLLSVCFCSLYGYIQEVQANSIHIYLFGLITF